MYIFTRYPLTDYLFKFCIISRDISQSSKISKKSKLKRDFYKHKSMLHAPFGSTMAPHINVSGLSCYFELVSWPKIRPPNWIVHSAEKSAQSIATFGNVDAKCGLVNKVENFDSATPLSSSAESSAQYCADLLPKLNLASLIHSAENSAQLKSAAPFSTTLIGYLVCCFRCSLASLVFRLWCR